MNIPKIIGLKLTSPLQERRQQNTIPPRYGLTMTKPLIRDTVTFKATAKMMGSRADEIPLQVAKGIHEEAKKALKYMEDKLTPFLYDLEATTYAPENPIEAILKRAKEPDSIREKAVTRGWNRLAEIKKEMTDLAGMKIIMRDGSREQVNKVIERLIQFVNETGIKIVEIENKRPLPIYNNYGEVVKSYDYASPMYLVKLQKIASKLAGRDIRYVDENTPTNYMAIHILTELPNGITGELQIMGHDIAALKELEDMCYKIKNGKNLKKKYAPIEKVLAPLKPPSPALEGVEDAEYLAKLKEHEFLCEEHLKYTKDAYMLQREKEPRKFTKRAKKESFLKIPSFLPQELDFNNLQELKNKCDADEVERLKSAVGKSAAKKNTKQKTK